MRLILFLAFAASAAAQPFAYSIDSFAGRERVPDGTAALGARFTSVSCVESDAAGAVYVCTVNNGGIFRIGTDGRVTRVFGSEVAGLSVFGPRDRGDGGPAVDAEGLPRDAAVAADGSIYLVQSNRIRRIDPQGVVTTIAGGPTSGDSGDGGPAVDAEMRTPTEITIAPDGSIYFSDNAAGRIRRIDADGIITTVAGGGPGPGPDELLQDGIPAVGATLRRPAGLAVDANGDVYFCERGTRRVRKVSAADGLVTTVAGFHPRPNSFPVLDGMPATDAPLISPGDVVLDPDGGFIIADGPIVRRVGEDGIIENIIPFDNRVNRPFTSSLTLTPSGDLLAAFNPTIQRVLPEGRLIAFAGGQDDRLAPVEADQAPLYFPNGVRYDNDENAVVVDSFNGVVRRAASDGRLETIAGADEMGSTPDPSPTPFVSLTRLRDIVYDSHGVAYITEWFNHWVRAVASNGATARYAGTGVRGFAGDGGIATGAQLGFPRGLAVDADDNLYVSDAGNHVVRRVDRASGIITTVAGSPYETGEERGFGGDGGPATDARLYSPRGLAFGPDGALYIADTLNNRIRRVDLETGVITTHAGTGEKGFSGDGGLASQAALNEPHRIVFDDDGYLYVADSYNHVLRMVDLAGAVHTIAGTPLTPGDSGNGGPALDALMNLPKGLDVATNGDVLFSDNDNHRVRILRPEPRMAEGAAVNAASFGPTVSPGSIATVFGTNLAGRAAQAQQTPLPTNLSYSRLVIVDSAGVEREAGQFFASKTQVNFYVDEETAAGSALLRIIRDNGSAAEIAMEIAAVSPGIFAVVPQAAESTGEVFLVIFGTGVRNADAVTVAANGQQVPVTFAGPQGQFVGLDQVVAGPLPAGLSGELSVVMTADGAASNAASGTI